MCLDSEGNIVGTAGNWISGPGPMIYMWTPADRVLETYPMPVGVEGPSNCAAGLPKKRRRFVRPPKAGSSPSRRGPDIGGCVL